MKTYECSRHAVWGCKYHMVWMTKYRYPGFIGDIGLRARDLLRKTAQSLEMLIYAGGINRDHVHLLIGILPNISMPRAAKYLKD